MTNSYNDQIWIHGFMANTFIAMGDLDNTLKELENIGRLAKQKSDTRQLAQNNITISMILYEHGKLTGAEERLSAARKLMESSLSPERVKKISLWRDYLSHSTLLALKKENIEQAKKYAEMYKNNIEQNGYINLREWCFTLSGLIAYVEENYEEAISDLKQSNLSFPINTYHLALAYLKIGDKANAFEKLESAVNYNNYVGLHHEIFHSRAEKQLARLRAGEEILH
jgi:tetratricopeptide (TPR) repeat protein